MVSSIHLFYIIHLFQKSAGQVQKGPVQFLETPRSENLEISLDSFRNVRGQFRFLIHRVDSLSTAPAAVDAQGLSGHIGGGGTAKKGDDPANFRRGADAAKRADVSVELFSSGVLIVRARIIFDENAWRNTIEAHALWPELHRMKARQMAHTGLRDVIAGVLFPGDEVGRHGRNENNGTPLYEFRRERFNDRLGRRQGHFKFSCP